MNQEDDNNQYFVFVGMLLFFIFGGLYFVVNLFFNSSDFSIFGNLINTVVEEPVKIENVRLNEEIFVEDKFKELELSSAYQFNPNALVVGGRNPFVVKPVNPNEKK